MPGTHVAITSFTSVSVACQSSAIPASKILFKKIEVKFTHTYG